MTATAVAHHDESANPRTAGRAPAIRVERLMTARVVVLDYGSGNLRSAERALARVGADVTVTADPDSALDCDGLVVPGVGAFAACMAGLRSVGGDKLIARRIELGRPVLGICVGMRVLLPGWSTASPAPAAPSGPAPSSDWTLRCCRTWAGTRSRPPTAPPCSPGSNRAPASTSSTPTPSGCGTRSRCSTRARRISVTEHGEPFAAAVEHGVVAAAQFHPEKSGDAGAQVLRNWLGNL
jgi:glutamine amidotransferase